MRRIRKILSMVLAFVLTFCGLGFQIPNVQAATNYITVTKTVNPTTITTLDEAQVTLSIKAAPPVSVIMPNDVILIIDKSGSMKTEDKITAAKNAAKSFVDLMDFTKHRVGVVDYSSANLVNSFNLTTDAAAAKSYIDGIVANGATDTGKAVEVATQMLANHRPEAQPVIVIMTDGAANVGPAGENGDAIGFQYAKDAAKAAKEAGIVFYTIALLNTTDNPDTSAPNLVLKEMATTAQHHHFVLGSVGLDVIYRQIVQEIGRASAYNVTVTDVVTPEFEIVPGSADSNIPKPEINGNTLTWKFHELKDQELIFNYKIRHKEGAPIGVLPISSNSVVQYKDYAGADLSAAIPSCNLTVKYPAPIINTVTPQSGLTTGGESVKIQGQYFRATPKVYFGAAEATIEQFVDATTIIVKAPPAATAGAVNVKVVNPDQQQAIMANGYTYEYPAPTVTSISPNSGFVTGGDTVTIQGTMFFRETKIFFGTKEVGIAYYFGPTKVNVVVPSAEAPGTVDVKVVNPDGKEVLLPGAYTYIKLPAPTITKITPNSGLVTGGDIVVIEGTNFSATSKVKFGDTELPLNKFYSSTKIEVVSPAAQSAGAVDVTVINVDAQSASVPGGFTYNELPPPPPPTITSLSPNSGLVTGGDTVTIQGSMLSKDTKIYFGNKEAAIIYYFGATKVNVRVPATETAGVVDVKVVNTDGQEATLPGSYTYIALPPPPPPTLTLVDPNTSLISGGVIAYISGSNLGRQAKVLFGGIEVPIHYYYSANKISVVVPAVSAPSVVDIKVTNPDGQSAELPAAFTYTAPPPPPAPTLTAITPNSSLISGGITATITGTNFKGKDSKVFVGQNEAQIFYVYNTTKMDIKIPASSTAGTVDVKIVNPEGQSAVLPAAFTYNEILPTITSASPNLGLVTGGDTVTILGSNFARDTRVFFGDIEVSLAYYYSSSKISAVSPAVYAPQTVNISIVNADGKSAVLANAFTYIPKPVEPAPTLNAISPNNGLVSGGNTATITGTNFKGKTSKVYVGGVEATISYVYNTMKMDIKVPASTSTGAKDVTIVNPDGQSYTLPGAYTYMPLPPEPAPVLSSLTPNSGSMAGGYYVTIQGANLKRTTKIYFGGTEVPINYYYGTTKVRVIAPAGSAGAVTVKVVNPDGQESLLVGGFTYTAP